MMAGAAIAFNQPGLDTQLPAYIQSLEKKGAPAADQPDRLRPLNQFRVYLVDWYLHRVYDELDGPLSNAIAPIPRS